MHEPAGRPVVTLLLFLAAVLGWGAFAGIWLRLGQAERAWHEQRARADDADRQTEAIRDQAMALVKEHQGIARLMQSRIDHLEERLRAAEMRGQP
jgi:hypothetical protein